MSTLLRQAAPRAGLRLVVAAALTACGGGGDSAGDPVVGTAGTLRLSLTDAPACGFDNVYVTVEKVRVHASGTAEAADGGWTDITLATPQRIDLLSLTNGAMTTLGQTCLLYTSDAADE